jgi:hypothetical protein
LLHTPADHLTDCARIERLAVDDRSQRASQQIGGVDLGERAVAPSNRCANGVDDHDFRHSAS